MENEANILTELFMVFLLLLFFAVPFSLLYLHHKKSKSKIQAIKQKEANEDHNVKSLRRQEHYRSVASVIGIVAGVLIGSRVLDNYLMGAILGAVFGGIAGFIVEKFVLNERE